VSRKKNADESSDKVTGQETRKETAIMYQRSTKGASKQRRDLINVEINEIKDLLPVSESVRKRLSQLQVMALCNSYIVKSNCFQNSISNGEWDPAVGNSSGFDFSEALPGFLMALTLDGKLLYISENVTEFLGHSVVELMTQADTVYDIIDRAEHRVLKDFLQSSKVIRCDGVKDRSLDELDFLCHMNLGQLFRRNNLFDRQKVMKVHGRVVWPEGPLTLTEPIFVGRVTPVLGCFSSEQLGTVPDTMMFTTSHSMDLKFIDIENNGEFHLGYKREELVDKSWYQLVHPDYTNELTRKHLQLVQKGMDIAKSLVIKVQTKHGQFVWMHVLMRFATPSFTSLGADSFPQEIICVNHIIDEKQAFDTIKRINLEEERFMTNGMHCAFDASSLLSQREAYVPTVVVGEEFLDQMMSENKPVNFNHEELMQRIRQKAQRKESKKPRLGDITSSDYNNGSHFIRDQNSLAPYLMNYTDMQYGGKQSKVVLKKDVPNPYTPSPSEDNLDSAEYGALTFTVPSPQFIAYTPPYSTPPYSPASNSYMEESAAMVSQQDEMSLFDGALPGVKQHQAVKRKREESESDDLPELDQCLVEHILQVVECNNPSSFNFQANSSKMSAPPQFAHNQSAINSGLHSAAMFQSVPASSKLNSSAVFTRLAHQNNVFQSSVQGLADFEAMLEFTRPLDLLNAAELFESYESPCTGLALHSF